MDNSEGVKVPERDLRHWIKRQLASACHYFTEPSVGSSTGVPDVHVLMPRCRHFLPVELKIAHEMRKFPEKLRIENLRAMQINWHVKVNTAGGWSCFLLGVPRPDGFDAYVLAHCSLTWLSDWRSGWPKEWLTKVSENNELDLVAWEQAMMQERAAMHGTSVPDLRKLPKTVRNSMHLPPDSAIPELNLTEWIERVAPE